MKAFTLLILNREKVSAIVIASVICAFILLTFRIKYTNTPYFLFLVWNLFLAGIPFIITTFLISLKTPSKLSTIFYFTMWLIFLPNAPYIVTDFYHLRLSDSHLIWLDALVIFCFAMSGLILFYFSLSDMYTTLSLFVKRGYVNVLIYGSCLLSGFGIYLGRFLRYNSWEILSNPAQLIKDCFAILLFPKAHIQAWLFVLLTGFVLSIGFYSFRVLVGKK